MTSLGVIFSDSLQSPKGHNCYRRLGRSSCLKSVKWPFKIKPVWFQGISRHRKAYSKERKRDCFNLHAFIVFSTVFNNFHVVQHLFTESFGSLYVVDRLIHLVLQCFPLPLGVLTTVSAQALLWQLCLLHPSTLSHKVKPDSYSGMYYSCQVFSP